MKGVVTGHICGHIIKMNSQLAAAINRCLTRAIVRFIISMNKTVAPKQARASSPNVNPR